MLIDTHAHINLHAFKDDAGEVIRRSLDAGVGVINVGTDIHTSKQAVDMLAEYPENVYAVVGLHPSHTYDNPYLDENESAFATGREVFDYEAYKQLALNEKVVGIGECGLDYYRLGDPSVMPDPDPASRLTNLDSGSTVAKAMADTSEAGMTNTIKQQQREAFEGQIRLAIELDKALVIHCRPSKGTIDAYEDLLGIISNYQYPISNERPLRFEVHSFTGPVEVAQRFVEMGGYIGLNGIITFDKTGNMEQVVKGVPLERIVLETDSPYLAPLPYRGKRNEPSYIVEVAKKIAEWKDISLEDVSAATTINAKKLFNI